MSEPELRLSKPPIVEAVVDVNCDMRPGFDLGSLEATVREAFRAEYPKLRSQFLEQHHIESRSDEPAKHSAKRSLQALQFLQDDEKQLVQIRAHGYSFNRLSPYTSLDDYLPEIRRTWELFSDLALPTQVRAVRLRYINRIPLPFIGARIDLSEYFTTSPKLPDNGKLQFAGSINQNTAVEVDTGRQAIIVLASQAPEGEKLPIIFDISVESASTGELTDWKSILAEIQSLRDLKNRIFRYTLSDTCLNLFRQ